MNKRLENIHKYRLSNNITGKCYYLNTVVPKHMINHYFKRGVLCPSGICLYTTKKYFIQEDPMTWSIIFITDNEDLFNKITNDHYAGEKGLFRNVDCWTVLQEMQMEGGSHYELDYTPLIVFQQIV